MRVVCVIAVLAHSCASSALSDPDPVADPAAVVFSPCGARFTVLMARLIRAERAFRDQPSVFDDRATFAVINRKLPVPAFHVDRDATGLTLTTSELRLVHKCEASAPWAGPGFGPGELSLTLLTAPFTKWETGSASPTRSPGSSVAQIVREPENLNVRVSTLPACRHLFTDGAA